MAVLPLGCPAIVALWEVFVMLDKAMNIWSFLTVVFTDWFVCSPMAVLFYFCLIILVLLTAVKLWRSF